MAIIAGSVLAAMLQHVFIIRKFPGFTFPFIAITWVLYYCFAHIYKLEAMPPPPEESNNFVITSHGFGEIIFQASISSGILFFIGVFIANPVAALYGLAAAVISAALAFYIHEPVAPIAEGLFSFNAVLCAITFGGTRKVDGLYVLAAILLALVIEVIMIKYNCSPYLTIPFVAACWIIVIIKKMLPKSLL
ncbi:Urea transporter [compost metagenome]